MEAKRGHCCKACPGKRGDSGISIITRKGNLAGRETMNAQKKQGHTVYQQFRKENLILRDYLALDRTVVAHEHTL